MNTSIFEVIGPVMIGPSSSHTAGAARLARVAGRIVGKKYKHVSFGLHGSFAKTYRGHGTDKALVAGALGLREDDERLAQAFALAEEAGLTYDFHEVELENAHENTVYMVFTLENGEKRDVTGSSIGGAQIRVTAVGGYETEFTADTPTLFIRQKDARGVISRITYELAMVGINIGVMRLSRKRRGENAFCVIETDEPIDDAVVEQLRRLPDIYSVQAINIE